MPKQFRDENSNEDGPSEGEKPLKKARFLWELKGKHHLKETPKINSVNNNNEEDFPVEQIDVSTNSTSQQINNKNNTLSVEESVSGTHDYFSSCGPSCLQTLVERASDDINNELDEISFEINFPVESPNSKNQEYYLRKWQARQIARSFVDNTINSVLESCIRPIVRVDGADLIDNYTRDGQVEDDAILMAIQSHGLQSGNSRLQTSSAIEQEEASDRNPVVEEFTQDNLENVENERIKEQESEIYTTDGSSGSNSFNQGLEMEETMDFLNAAVSVAIQKKGLSYGY